MNKDFMWGGSTSAFQYEGGSFIDEKGISIYDTREQKNGITYSIASDFYHRYKEDIALMAEMGFNSFRMSISWTRIYPTGIEESPNQKGIEFYKNVFEELKKHNIKPVVTLFHWDMPQYIIDNFNGFKSKEIIELFSKYCKTCFEEFGEYVEYWLTLNENNLGILLPSMFLKDKVKQGDADFEQVKWDTYFNSMVCHFTAVKLCHEILPQAKIGCMMASAYAYPLSPKPEDIIATQNHNRSTMWYDLDIQTTGIVDERLYNELKLIGVEVNLTLEEKELMAHPLAKIDFISFSYYFSLCMQAEGNNKNTEAETMQMMYQGYYNPYLEKTTFGWQIDPLGLRGFMNELYDRYKLPVMIVENGCGVENDILTSDGTVHDDYRIDYLQKHIQEVVNTVNLDHVPVMGYLPWGCIDLYSAGGNRNKRYGFVYVDFDNDLNRYKKDSFYWFQEVIKSNGAHVFRGEK